MMAFMAHCAIDKGEERCGLFVVVEGQLTFVACDNIAYDRKNSFMIHPTDIVTQSNAGDVIGVGHSHVTVSAKPSDEDRVNSENCRLPFVIFQPDTGDIDSYDPIGIVPDLIGRRWVLGVSDCYTLARDYYKKQDLELRDYVRNDVRTLYKESMFEKHFSENGFHVVSDTPHVHDAFLIQVSANVANHVAILVDDDVILHHLQNRLSCREVYGGYWRRHTMYHLRHERWL